MPFGALGAVADATGSTRGAAGRFCAERVDATSRPDRPRAAGIVCSCMVLLARLCLAVLLERELAIVLAEKIQEALVLARIHVEQTRHDLVVAARLLESPADDLPDVRARDLAIHEERIDRRPERFALLDNALVEIVGDRATALAFRTERHRVVAANLHGQIADVDDRLLDGDDDSLDHILELTDVAGP